jgi:hypothetical protein
MSAQGPSRRFDGTIATSGLPLVNGHSQDRRAYLKDTTSGSGEPYSITSSARDRIAGGTASPSILIDL